MYTSLNQCQTDVKSHLPHSASDGNKPKHGITNLYNPELPSQGLTLTDFQLQVKTQTLILFIMMVT